MIIGNLPVGPSDLVRQLVNLAVNSGRSRQSSQTGYVHYCYRQLDYPTHDTIPIYENFLFALALMRERTAESFAEGKALVDKLLYFQEPSGNFPVYLHEYPVCKDRYVAAYLLPVVYWILKTFPAVLGPELRERLEAATNRMVEYCLRQREEGTSFLIDLKIACAMKALAVLWEKSEWEKNADVSLDESLRQSQEPSFIHWFVPASLGDALLALQMVYPSLTNSPWKALWHHLECFWHTHTASYVGPGLRDQQARDQPEVTMLDLIMGFHARTYSHRALLNGPHMLQAALIHPTTDVLAIKVLPARQEGLVAERRWFVSQETLWACSAIESDKPDPSKDNFYSPLRIMWGDVNCVHSFVCQGNNAERISFTPVEDGVDLLFTLPTEVPNEIRQRNREVMFFLDLHEDATFIVGEVASATTFQLNEPVTITSGGMTITVRLHLEQGVGNFFGHIARGNRPSQKCTTGEGRFKAYDWQLFLRTIGRDSNCRLRAEVRFNMGGKV